MSLQYSLPKRRKVNKMGLREVRREFPRHRKFVRSHGCCVPECDRMPIEFAHIRSAANSGVAVKPHDAFGISLCTEHHRYQHQVGQSAFEYEFKIDLARLAAEFVKRSPDTAMRESLKLQEPA